MKVYGRFLVDGVARYAEIEGATAHFVGDLFSSPTRTGESSPVAALHILAPVAPSKVFAVGLNYRDHAAESKLEVPKWPLMWFKAPTAVIGHRQAVELVFPEHRTDYEAELTVVIGRTARRVAEADALDYVFGYTLGQDISDRNIQHSESQWARAKSFDTYAPIGPYIYTGIDASNLPVETRVNGEVKQKSNTEQLVFNVAQLVAFLSEGITMQPGDIIMTGTPYGVGPLKDGDVIETRIGDMEQLVTPVRNAQQ